jgi:hypothetical protein
MTHHRRWPVTLGCHGTEDIPHELVTWVGTWVPGDESTSEPACWVCGGHPYSTPPRYPYVRGTPT